jgi:DNA replication and repair protein RecF
MSLVKIEAHDVRNIQYAAIEPSPHLNFVVGPNASGKTSLLEAVYILGRARSFRTSQISQVIRFGQNGLMVTGKVVDDTRPAMPIGVRVTRGEREIHLEGRKIQSSAELIGAFPVLVIQPASSTLLEGAPKYRRQFLDWGVFHFEESYLDCWRRYVRALSQRNTLLREKRLGDIALWNREVARYGTIMNGARDRYAEKLKPFLLLSAAQFFEGFEFELHLQSGWSKNKTLEAALQEDVASDVRLGYTQSGPHKADFSISLDGRPARAYLSRGQMKLLVYSLLLAQSLLMEESADVSACVLIDDVASELDEDNKHKLLGFLRERRTQFFITATADRVIRDAVDDDAAVFHVEHGQVMQA